MHNALTIADDLGMSVEEIATTLGIDPAAVRADPCNGSLQGDLQRLHDIDQRLRHLFNDDINAIRSWVRTPRPQLEGATPLQILHRRQFKSIESLLGAMEYFLP